MLPSVFVFSTSVKEVSSKKNKMSNDDSNARVLFRTRTAQHLAKVVNVDKTTPLEDVTLLPANAPERAVYEIMKQRQYADIIVRNGSVVYLVKLTLQKNGTFDSRDAYDRMRSAFAVVKNSVPGCQRVRALFVTKFNVHVRQALDFDGAVACLVDCDGFSDKAFMTKVNDFLFEDSDEAAQNTETREEFRTRTAQQLATVVNVDKTTQLKDAFSLPSVGPDVAVYENLKQRQYADIIVRKGTVVYLVKLTLQKNGTFDSRDAYRRMQDEFENVKESLNCDRVRVFFVSKFHVNVRVPADFEGEVFRLTKDQIDQRFLNLTAEYFDEQADAGRRGQLIGALPTGNCYKFTLSDKPDYSCKHVIDLSRVSNRATLVEEIKLLTNFNDDNFLKYVSVDEETSADVVSVFTEYLDVVPISEYISERVASGTAATEVVTDLIKKLVTALECAHSKEVVLGDLQSCMIGVTADGKVKIDRGDWRRHLTDASKGSLSKMTQSRRVAPEATATLGSRTKSANIWNLGAIVYDMVFPDPDREGVAEEDESVSVAIERHQRSTATLDQTIAEFLNKCLEPNPTLRPDAQALNKFLTLPPNPNPKNPPFVPFPFRRPKPAPEGNKDQKSTETIAKS